MARKKARRSSRYGSSKSFWTEEQASSAPKEWEGRGWRKTRGTVTPTQKLRTGSLPSIVLSAGCDGKNKPGQVDLVFLGQKDADAIGGKAGPNLRLCVEGRGKGKRTRGMMVPVASPVEARDLALEYSRCAKKAGACSPTAKACMADEGGKKSKGKKSTSSCEKANKACDQGRAACGLDLFGKSAFGRWKKRG